MTYSRPTIADPARILKNIKIRPGMIFGAIIVTALFFFEIFNYSTTDFALRDLLGDLRFAGIRWSTTLAIAFCTIDFAGLARLFTPGEKEDEAKEVWYLFGAWLLAATMNAALTWWGVSMAVANHNIQSASVVNPGLALKVVPIFVAVMVWTIRILIIGTISVAGNRLFGGQPRGGNHRPSMNMDRRSEAAPNRTSSMRPTAPVTTRRPASSRPTISMEPRANAASSAYPRPSLAVSQEDTTTEPTYHSLSMSANSLPVSSSGVNFTANSNKRS